MLDAAEYLKMSNIPGPQRAHNFWTHPRVRAELSHPLVSREEIRVGTSKRHLCVKEKALFAGSGVLPGPAHLIPDNRTSSASPSPF